MAEQIIKSKMQQKRGTSAEIASSTEVLLDGEIIYDKTNNKFKVGNGSSQIKDLPYLKGDGDYLPLAGGTVTGPLNVPTPTTDSNAATKKYVDDADRTLHNTITQEVTSKVSNYLPLAGGTMTGPITMPANTQISMGGTGYLMEQGGVLQIQNFNNGINFNSMKLSGVKSPIDSNEAASKGYVDENVNGVTSRVDSLESAISNISTPELRTVTFSEWTTSGDKFTQTETVSGISSTETAQLITVTPKISNMTAYYDAGVYASSQSTNSLTFTATTKPTSTLTVYVIIQKL